ncbi:hypothetical protein DFH07DRAFT_1060491 [Mycena maculata]|uniref:Uncharacterized protein n=1 Tax=Mycena maculata TaxID=230809 RepID=A0AAD7J843_9AGAR|nr:hypothetical protein DFH07DRAFT_1060491 [Mycena maculata]
MSRNLSRPPLDNENGYEERAVQQGGYPHPSAPPQALRAGPQRQYSRPTMRDPQPGPALQSRYPEQPVLERQRSRPDQQYQERPVQRQRSRPDQEQLPQPVLQRQRSRPDQQYPERPLPQTLQRQPSRPDQYSPEETMPNPYLYDKVPQPVPVAPVFVQAHTTPSDSQTTLSSQTILPKYATIMRGNSDDELDNADVFWRRFNANAQLQQLPDAEKSSWLEKNEGKSTRYSRRLWLIGLLLVILAAVGIGVGVFISFHDNSNTSRPDAIGGAADAGTVTAAGTAVSTAVGTAGGTATSSSPVVHPTNTVP